MRSTDTRANIQRQIDALTDQLHNLQTSLNNLIEDQPPTSSENDTDGGGAPTIAHQPHQYDQDGRTIFANDHVWFRPSGTRSGSSTRARGVITRFTAQRVYIRRETDRRERPQEILRDPSHTRLITKNN